MRQWLIDLREKKGFSRKAMAEKCECTSTMLYILEENDAITHPKIAARIADGYGFKDVNLFNELVPQDRRVKRIPKRETKPIDRELTWEELTANGLY